MEMSDRIKERRTAMGFTQEELGKKLGLQKSAIAKYENGRVENIKRSVIAEMAEVLDCSPSYLMGWDDTKKEKNINNIYPIEVRSLPMLGEIACGKPIFMDENRDSYTMIGSNVKADFCLKAKGDSMVNARIMDGDIVFIKSQPEVENGEIAAVAIDDEATLKRFYRDEITQTVTLISENPIYAPMVFTKECQKNVYILGKAVAFQSDVK